MKPDFDQMWLRDAGAEIKVTFTNDKRAQDIVRAVRKRWNHDE